MIRLIVSTFCNLPFDQDPSGVRECRPGNTMELDAEGSMPSLPALDISIMTCSDKSCMAR